MVTVKSGCPLFLVLFFFFLRNPVGCKRRFHGVRSVVLKAWMDFRLVASASRGGLQEVQITRLPFISTESEKLRGGHKSVFNKPLQGYGYTLV